MATARRVLRPSRPARARRTRITHSVRCLALSLAVALPAVAWAGPAQAQDTPAEVEAEIDEAWRKLEPIIEEHNATRIELKQKRKQADALAEKIKPLERRVSAAQNELSDLAAYSFKGGNTSAFRAMLTTGSPLTLGDQLAMLDQLARAQQDRIAAALTAKRQYEAEKAELDTLVDELAEMEEKLAERADDIDAEIDRLKELRDDLIAEQAAEQEAAEDEAISNGDCPASFPGGSADAALSFACAQIGKPYGWGAAGPDAYDCSGLTMAAWEQAGVSLPHNAAQQRDAIPYVERSNLRPGDLVFYYSDLSHVGMYIGGGMIVHASNPSKPVGTAPIDRSPIHSYGRPG